MPNKDEIKGKEISPEVQMEEITVSDKNQISQTSGQPLKNLVEANITIKKLEFFIQRKLIPELEKENFATAFSLLKIQIIKSKQFAEFIQKDPDNSEAVNKLLLDAFKKIDNTFSKYKYPDVLNDLETRVASGKNIFSNIYLDKDTSTPLYMDKIMQKIIDTRISFFRDNKRKHLKNLFTIHKEEPKKASLLKRFFLSIRGAFIKLFNIKPKKVNPELWIQKEINSAVEKAYKSGSKKVKSEINSLAVIVQRRLEYTDTMFTASTNALINNDSFENGLKKLRVEIGRIVNELEIENLYRNSLGLSPVDVDEFVKNQELMFKKEYEKKNNVVVDIPRERPLSNLNMEKRLSVKFKKRYALIENSKYLAKKFYRKNPNLTIDSKIDNKTSPTASPTKPKKYKEFSPLPEIIKTQDLLKSFEDSLNDNLKSPKPKTPTKQKKSSKVNDKEL